MSLYYTKPDRTGEHRFIQTDIESDLGSGLLSSETGGLRVAVTGSRNFTDYEKMKEVLDQFLTPNALLISGGNPGADALVERYAIERNRTIHVIAPDWDQHGNQAGFIRDREIVDHASMLVAFHDGVSKETKHVIDLIRSEGRPCLVVEDKNPDKTRCPPYYSDKPLTEKQEAFLRENGTEAAVRTLEAGDYRAARIHLDITFDRIRKEVEEVKREKGITERRTVSSKSQAGPEQ